MCGRFYIAEEDKAEELQRIIDLMNRKYNGNPGIKTQGEIRPTDTIMTIANRKLVIRLNITLFPFPVHYLFIISFPHSCVQPFPYIYS